MGETETVTDAVETGVELEAEGGLSLVSHAGFIPRLVAYLLDMALLSIPLMAYVRATGPTRRLLAAALPIAFPDLGAWVLWGVFAGGTFAYFAILEAHAGRTVGKRIAGIKVVGPAGDPPDPVRALLRNLYRALYHLPIAGQVILAVDGALVLRSGRRLGDMAADTRVVKVPQEWT